MKIKALLLGIVLCTSAQAAGSFAELALYAKPLGRVFVRSVAGSSPLMATVTPERFFSTHTEGRAPTLSTDAEKTKDLTSKAGLVPPKITDSWDKWISYTGSNCVPTITDFNKQLGEKASKIRGWAANLKPYSDVHLALADRDLREGFERSYKAWQKALTNTNLDKAPEKVLQDINRIEDMASKFNKDVYKTVLD